ncbi:MAG TPA: MaoC family dehydratase [Pyrinomonadaceae bacterium]|nr:MaoC family dehydratase [Pyrinomonadaceae bacterium]
MKFLIGDTFSKERTVTDELVRAFAEVSGDYNPIHLDDEFAASTRFGRRISHGMLTAAFISGVLGNQSTERKLVYLGQTIKFTLPVYIGDTITTTSTVKAIRDDRNIVTFETVCTNQNGETVLSGEGALMVLD